LCRYVSGEKDAFRQLARAKSGFGVDASGVDKYTGETLEAIARRASEAALADAAMVAAAGGLAVDGTAVTGEGFVARVEEVKSGGKCWSVDQERSVMGDLKA
jgi:lysozyme family protein